MARNLIYTLALDYVETTAHRNLAKLLVSSLLRTRFSGDILVFHTSPAPLFMVAREGVREVVLDVPAEAFARAVMPKPDSPEAVSAGTPIPCRW